MWVGLLNQYNGRDKIGPPTCGHVVATNAHHHLPERLSRSPHPRVCVQASCGRRRDDGDEHPNGRWGFDAKTPDPETGDANRGAKFTGAA